MFCPECGAEYRPGFTHCNDCDVDLVDELPESDQPEAAANPLAGADLRIAWESRDEGECAAICDTLEDAAIPFQINQQAEDFFFGGSGQRFEIRVPAELLERAKELAQQVSNEISQQTFAESGENTIEISLDEEEEETRPADQNPEPLNDAPASGSDDPRHWFPEDAIAEVWAGDDPKLAGMIQMSLREHQILVRTETLDDGSWQIFVLPQQKSRALKIIRQILDATPD